MTTTVEPEGRAEVDTPDPSRRRRFSAPSLGNALRSVAFIAFVVYAASSIGTWGSQILVNASIAVCISVGLHALIHWSGQVSLGQMAFVGVGGFMAANLVVENGVSLPLAMIGGALVATAASLLIGLPALKIRGFPLAVTTLAAASAAQAWLFRQEWLVGGPLGLLVLDTDFVGYDSQEPSEFAAPAMVVAALLVLLTARLGGSGVGRSMRLMAADEEVAASYGVRVGLHKLLAFLYAGFCAGVAGGLQVFALGRAAPEMFPASESIIFVAAVLIGGRGSVFGSVVAAASLVIFPEFFDFGRYTTLISSSGLILAVRFLPGGINAFHERMRGNLVGLVERFRNRRGSSR